MYDAFVVGDYSIDLIFTGLAAMPALGAEEIASQFHMVPGEAYSCAVGMHRLGLKVAWAGDFGSDEFSHSALEHARLEGLEETYFVRHNRPYRRVSVSVSFPVDRAFITYYDPSPTVPAALKAMGKISARLVYVPGFFSGGLLEIGSKVAHARGMKIIMDGNSGAEISLKDDRVRKAIKNVDVLLPNVREALFLTGEKDLDQAIQGLGKICPLVVVKAGSDGAYACVDGQLVHAPALPVQPVDTTGAGDLFNAGFIKAWLDERPLLECLKWGNIVGGLSTLGLGATSQKVTIADVEKYLAAG